MTSTLHNYGRSTGQSTQSYTHGSTSTKPVPTTAAADADIAPWLSTGPSAPNGGFDNGNFFGERLAKSHTLPTARPGTQHSESVDPMYYDDERRPSVASATTVSSQNSASVSRTSTGHGHHSRRLGAFFGDDGQDSLRSSDTSILTTNRDHSISSQSRKARHNSVQTNNTDGRPGSPSSSRPRSPIPSSDITPWLFQDFKVSARDFDCSCAPQTIYVCSIGQCFPEAVKPANQVAGHDPRCNS